MEKTTAPRQATDYIVLGMGCFWGAEKRMGEIPGVIDVESGYAGGDLPGAGYQDILNHERALRTGKTTARNHAEVVKVSFNPAKVTLETVLAKFWENHNPTQGDRQGNDVGSNYRSAIYYHDANQKAAGLATQAAYQKALDAAGYGRITTEILPLKNYIHRRGIPPELSEKESRRLLRLGRHRSEIPGFDQKNCAGRYILHLLRGLCGFGNVQPDSTAPEGR